MDLRGRRVLVTGGSSGIGAAAARLFAQAGAHVVLVSEREADLNAVADAICAAGGAATALVADFSKPEQVAGLIARVEAQAGSLDVLVNNAGVGLGANILETKPSELRFLFDVNFFALADLCRQALAAMSGRGQGHIINIGSASGLFGSPGVSAYSATKGAVHAFTQALRIEARAYGVQVSEVLPISVQTHFFENVKGQKYRPGGVVLTTERVARSVVRCAASRNPRAEVLPFRPIRIVFVMEAIFPGLLGYFVKWQAKKESGDRTHV